MSDTALQKPEALQQPRSSIHTIPMDFYGGKNPAPTEIPTASAPVTNSVNVPTKPKLPPPRPQEILQPANNLTKPTPQKMLPIIIASAAVIILGGGTAAWFLIAKKAPAVPAPLPVAVVAPPPAPVVEPAAPTSITPEATSTPQIVVATTTIALIPPHDFRDSTDSDTDGLTDIEEELWTTDPAKTDSDGDTYGDQTELLNLYNPAAIAPQRLVESKLVTAFGNATFGYSLHYPSSWIARALDETTNKEILFTAISGEYIEVQALPYPVGESFPDWFAKNFPAERLAGYTPFVNRFKVAGIMSPDKTVAFITDGSQVYLIRYDGGTRTEINYRTTFRTMVQSFKPVGVATPIDLLPKPVVIVPITATTTPEENVTIPEITTSTATSTSIITTSTTPVAPL